MGGIRISARSQGCSTIPYSAAQVIGDQDGQFNVFNCRKRLSPYVGPGPPYSEEMNNPILSPDGSKIVFNENFPGPNAEGQIQMIPSGGGAITTLSPDDAGGPWMIHPQWHPDSDRVIYIHADPDEGFNGSIVRVDIGTPGTETVLYTPAIVGLGGHGPYRPQYNRDGTKIAFILNTETGGNAALGGLYVMNADGSSPTLIDNFEFFQFEGSQFSWGPGDVIVYNDADEDVYKINADGTGKTQLNTDETATQLCRISNRAWSSDDSFIIGSSRTFIDALVWRPYRFELNGSGDTRLNDDHGPANVDFFRCVYRHPVDDRVYFIERANVSNPGWLASIAEDGSDYQLDVTLDQIDGNLFYLGTGIEWI